MVTCAREEEVGGSRIDVEALTIAMAIAPGAYARNRLYTFHKHPDVRRAKRRAATLRGIVRQLLGTQGRVDGLTMEHGPRAGRVLLRLRLPAVRLERQTELSEAEAACVLILAARAGAKGLPLLGDERAVVHAALRRLTTGLMLESGVFTAAMANPDEPK